MKAIKSFADHLKLGVIKKQSADRPRAEFLIKSADISFKGLVDRIKKLGIDDNNANSIVKDWYDIILELIRAKMFLSGYNAAGQGAHETEVSYLRELEFSENEVQFIDQIRYFRNGILYYGTILDKEYASKVTSSCEKIYLKLKNMLNIT